MAEKFEAKDDNPNLIEQADKSAARLEEANKKTAELLERMERNREIDILSGKSEASEPKREITPDEKLRRGALDMFKGTEIEQALHKFG